MRGAWFNYTFLTSKERDNETGLDYFLARYYSSTQGRFTSPDLLSGRPGSPQSWNRYAYSINNPLKYIDPDGLWWYTKNGGETDPTKNGGNPLVRQFKADGPTHELSGPNGDVIDQATGSGDTLEVAVTRDKNGAVMIHAKGDESNVLVTGSPRITYDLNITVTSQGTKGNATAQVSGAHDGFPAYEVIVSRPELPNVVPVVAYGSDPTLIGKAPRALFGSVLKLCC